MLKCKYCNVPEILNQNTNINTILPLKMANSKMLYKIQMRVTVWSCVYLCVFGRIHFCQNHSKQNEMLNHSRISNTHFTLKTYATAALLLLLLFFFLTVSLSLSFQHLKTDWYLFIFVDNNKCCVDMEWQCTPDVFGFEWHSGKSKYITLHTNTYEIDTHESVMKLKCSVVNDSAHQLIWHVTHNVCVLLLFIICSNANEIVVPSLVHSWRLSFNVLSDTYLSLVDF